MVCAFLLDLHDNLLNTGCMYQITETLFVGNIYEVERPPAAIGALLLVAEEFTPSPPAGLIYERIPFTEFGEAKAASLNQAIDWIERHHQDNRVLVCCRAGMGRSVSVVMAYLCCVQNMAYPDVFQLMMARRPGACPLPNIQATIRDVHRLRLARLSKPA
jgi:protein-tyrosine phosphatase